MDSPAQGSSPEARRKAQLARNEHVFRTVNDRIQEQAATFERGEPGDSAHLYEFFCECIDIGCADQVRLHVHEYHAVRRHDARFVIATAHDARQIERVVDRNPRYWVVEKVGTAGAVARELASDS